MNDEDNERLLEDVSKEEMQIVSCFSKG